MKIILGSAESVSTDLKLASISIECIVHTTYPSLSSLIQDVAGHTHFLLLVGSTISGCHRNEVMIKMDNKRLTVIIATSKKIETQSITIFHYFSLFVSLLNFAGIE